MASDSLESTVSGGQELPLATPLGRATGWTKAAQPLLLLFSDIVALTGAVLLTPPATTFWVGSPGPAESHLLSQPVVPLAFVMLCMTIFASSRTYHRRDSLSLAAEVIRILAVVSFVGMFLGSLLVLLWPARYDLIQAPFLWALASLFLLAARMLAVKVLEALRRRGIGCRRIVIIGTPESASFAAKRLQHRGSPYEVVGLVEWGNGRGSKGRLGLFPRLGTVDDLSEILEAHSPCEVLIAAPANRYASIAETLYPRIPRGIPAHLALYPVLNGVRVQEMDTLKGGLPTLQLRTGPFSWEYETVKRAFDVAMTLFALVLVSPLIATIALAIKLDSPGPVFFRQRRIGRHGQSFYMYKFRSMQQNAEALRDQLLQQNDASGPMFKMGNDPRITQVGKFLRRLSLDELPQLFNILQGTMSLVGPRPPLPDELREYRPEHFRRLEARPGLTGLWQVNRGRDNSFDEMVQLDIAYIEHWSLAKDLHILLKTLPALLSSRSVY